MKNIISIENVSFAYNKENVLQDIILSVDEGDFVGIIGCNGSGKSTLMKLLIGQLAPSKGKIKLFNEDLSKSNKLNKIGYVPQISLSSGATFPATVEEVVMANLYSKIGFMKFPKKEHKEKVKEALRIVNMEEYSKRLIGNLSGGQQKRLQISRGLYNSPKLIVMDDPFNAIDLEMSKNITDNIIKEYKESIFVLINNQKEILQKMDYIIFLKHDSYIYGTYEEMMKGISEIAPGSDGLITLPYFAGERTPLNDPDARGMIVGLSLSHTKRHLYRSALEGIGYSVAQHIDIFRENGLPVNRIAAAGGGTKNAVWMQMVADIAGVSLETPKEDIGAAYGDALMAAIGVGFYQGFSDLRQVIQKKCIYKPDLERHELYKPFRKLFDELYRCNQEILHSLSKHNK